MVERLREIECEELGLDELWMSYFDARSICMVGENESDDEKKMMRFGYARKMIERYQTVAMSACLNVYRTVSTEAMQILMGDLLWDLEHLRRGVRSRIRRNVRLYDWNVASKREISKVGPDECLRLLDERLYETWQNRWDVSGKGGTTHGFVPIVCFAERHSDFYPSLWLGYLLTGHGSMNAFLYDRGLSKTECCARGAECEVWKHVMFECSLCEDVRKVSEWGEGACA